MDRTGGGALMRRLVLDDMKHLIFAKLDRLGRNVKNALGVLELLSERGESITTQGHMGKLILTVLLPVALWLAGLLPGIQQAAQTNRRIQTQPMRRRTQRTIEPVLTPLTVAPPLQLARSVRTNSIVRSVRDRTKVGELVLSRQTPWQITLDKYRLNIEPKAAQLEWCMSVIFSTKEIRATIAQQQVKRGAKEAGSRSIADKGKARRHHPLTWM